MFSMTPITATLRAAAALLCRSVRTDPGKSEKFKKAQQWQSDGHVRFFESTDRGDGKKINLSHSFSGHERNRLFLSQHGRRFTDATLVSGMASKADGRGTVIWDFDRDGWLDFAAVNANTPQLQVFHNRIGQAGGQGNYIAFRFVGGNQHGQPSPTYSARDGYGAKVFVHLPDGRTLVREHRCGEGFSAQNSATLLVGIGASQRAEKIVVQWPSGIQQQHKAVNAGELLVCHEASTRIPFARKRYAPESPVTVAQFRPRPEYLSLRDPSIRANPRNDFTLYLAMATWCEKCKAELPQLAYLRSLHPPGQLRIVGIPADRSETSEVLRGYMDEYAPSYELSGTLTASDRETFENVLGESLHKDSLSIPAVLLVDSVGMVKDALNGVPSASWLRKAMAQSP